MDGRPSSVSPLPEVAPLAELEPTPPEMMDPTPAPPDDLPPPPPLATLEKQDKDVEKREEGETRCCVSTWMYYFEYVLSIIGMFLLLVAAIGLVLFWSIFYRKGYNTWKSDKDSQFNLHPTLMVFGICFNAFAIVLYRLGRCSCKLYIKLLHGFFNLLALACYLVGLFAVFEYHQMSDSVHFMSLHSWVGLATLGLLITQFFFGFKTYILLMCCERATTCYRTCMTPLHTAFGFTIFMLAVATAISGLVQKSILTLGEGAMQSERPEEMQEQVVLNCLGIVLIALAVAVTYIIARRRCRMTSDTFVSESCCLQDAVKMKLTQQLSGCDKVDPCSECQMIQCPKVKCKTKKCFMAPIPRKKCKVCWFDPCKCKTKCKKCYTSPCGCDSTCKYEQCGPPCQPCKPACPDQSCDQFCSPCSCKLKCKKRCGTCVCQKKCKCPCKCKVKCKNPCKCRVRFKNCKVPCGCQIKCCSSRCRSAVTCQNISASPNEPNHYRQKSSSNYFRTRDNYLKSSTNMQGVNNTCQKLKNYYTGKDKDQSSDSSRDKEMFNVDRIDVNKDKSTGNNNDAGSNKQNFRNEVPEIPVKYGDLMDESVLKNTVVNEKDSGDAPQERGECNKSGFYRVKCNCKICKEAPLMAVVRCNKCDQPVSGSKLICGDDKTVQLADVEPPADETGDKSDIKNKENSKDYLSTGKPACKYFQKLTKDWMQKTECKADCCPSCVTDSCGPIFPLVPEPCVNPDICGGTNICSSCCQKPPKFKYKQYYLDPCSGKIKSFKIKTKCTPCGTKVSCRGCKKAFKSLGYCDNPCCLLMPGSMLCQKSKCKCKLTCCKNPCAVKQCKCKFNSCNTCCEDPCELKQACPQSVEENKGPMRYSCDLPKEVKEPPNQMPETQNQILKPPAGENFTKPTYTPIPPYTKATPPQWKSNIPPPQQNRGSAQPQQNLFNPPPQHNSCNSPHQKTGYDPRFQQKSSIPPTQKNSYNPPPQYNSSNSSLQGTSGDPRSQQKLSTPSHQKNSYNPPPQYDSSNSSLQEISGDPRSQQKSSTPSPQKNSYNPSRPQGTNCNPSPGQNSGDENSPKDSCELTECLESYSCQNFCNTCKCCECNPQQNCTCDNCNIHPTKTDQTTQFPKNKYIDPKGKTMIREPYKVENWKSHDQDYGVKEELSDCDNQLGEEPLKQQCSSDSSLQVMGLVRKKQKEMQQRTKACVKNLLDTFIDRPFLGKFTNRGTQKYTERCERVPRDENKQCYPVEIYSNYVNKSRFKQKYPEEPDTNRMADQSTISHWVHNNEGVQMKMKQTDSQMASKTNSELPYIEESILSEQLFEQETTVNSSVQDELLDSLDSELTLSTDTTCFVK